MKLDYLQFLELEVFTRFGARLEASMAETIQRGNLLREILKQDRLSPLSPIFQLAWLIAFNDGLFEGMDPETVAPHLERIAEAVHHTSLTLDSPREEWSLALGNWLDSTTYRSTS